PTICPPPASPLSPYTTLFRSAGPLRPLCLRPPRHPLALGGVAAPPGVARPPRHPRGLGRYPLRPGARLRPPCRRRLGGGLPAVRSEEHTSELQSRSELVCRLL